MPGPGRGNIMLKIENASKTFNPGTINEKVALDHISLILEDGDFATIVGSNGAGKSTLFNAIAGSFITDEGYIELDGMDITFLKEHRRSQFIGRLFQDPLMGTAPHMTIEENIAFGLKIKKKSKQYIKDKIAYALKLVNLKGYEKRMPDSLSGGQQQRTSIGRTLITRPSIVLADEPTGNLDTKASNEIMHLLKTSNRELNQTIIMITHNMELAKAADRTIMIEDGKIR